MARPTAITANILEPVKGWDNSQLTIELPYDTTLSAIDVYAGRVCHIDVTSGKAKLGVDDNGVALFPYFNSYDQHVYGTGVKLSTWTEKDEAYLGGSPRNGTGTMLFLVATGAFELETTEWIAASEAQYVPNKPLTADLGTDIATDGILKPGSFYVDACCGVVSRGLVSTGVGGTRKSLAFWCTHQPKLTAAAITTITT